MKGNVSKKKVQEMSSRTRGKQSTLEDDEEE
jgi:hypothetical protein